MYLVYQQVEVSSLEDLSCLLRGLASTRIDWATTTSSAFYIRK